jgi:hypothetical protein
MASRSFMIMAQRRESENCRLELLRSAPMNSWLALSEDETRIIAIGKTFMEADAIAKRSGETNFVITRTPDEWMSRALLPIR